jgi:cytochrome c2
MKKAGQEQLVWAESGARQWLHRPIKNLKH